MSESSISFLDEKDREQITRKDISVILTIKTKVLKEDEVDYYCICKNEIENKKEDNPRNKSVFIEHEIVNTITVDSIEKIKYNKVDKKNQAEQKVTQVKLKDVCNQLKLLGYPITGSMISIFLEDVNDFVFYGSDPVDSNIFLDSEQINLNYIQMQIINYIDEKSLMKAHLGISDDEKNEDEVNDKSESEIGVEKGNKIKRTKERKIGYIIEKVHAWRKLYNGFYNSNGDYVRYSLEKAAELVKISKKSLDDYLLQLRLGRKYGFDFNKNKNEKVGELRTFVKRKRYPENTEDN